MSKTNNIVSKIAITFVDGSYIELIDAIRFVQIRDALKTASVVNNQLNEQLKELERKIEELQTENKILDDNFQSLVNDVSDIKPPIVEFNKPLP